MYILEGVINIEVQYRNFKTKKISVISSINGTIFSEKKFQIASSIQKKKKTKNHQMIRFRARKKQ